MNKKYIFIGLGLVILIASLVIWVIKPFSKKPTTSTDIPSSQKTLSANTLPIEKRPYIKLEPKSSVEPKSLGHWITMTIQNVNNFDRLEYEFEYTTGSMIQGGMGRIDFSVETPPVSKEVAFGSASKGKYKYDEGVYKGSFTFHFFQGETEEVLKTDFALQKMEGTQTIFKSPDEIVKLTVEKPDLSAGDYVLISSSLGLPAPVTGKILAGPYSFFSDRPRSLTKAQLLFDNVASSAVIFAWDNNRWSQLETKITDKKASANIDFLGTYILVQK